MTVQEVRTAPDRYSIRVEDYVLLGKAGAFRDFAKTELIEGEIIAVQAQCSPHSRAHTLLLKALSRACDALGDEVQPWVELSILLDDETMPQPDIVVARGLPDNGPLPVAQVALIVEVADTSTDFDLGAKARIYASAGVPEYWVADVNMRVIHQMWAPAGENYTRRREIVFGERIEATTVAGLMLEPRNL